LLLFFFLSYRSELDELSTDAGTTDILIYLIVFLLLNSGLLYYILLIRKKIISKWIKIYPVLLVLSTILIFITAGYTSLFTPEPQEPHIYVGSGNGTDMECRTNLSPHETYWYTQGKLDEKEVYQVFSKNITTNFSSFLEDLQIARMNDATVDERKGWPRSEDIDMISINETNALMNVTIIYPSGDIVERVVPFVREDGIWKIDMSPKYL